MAVTNGQLLFLRRDTRKEEKLSNCRNRSRVLAAALKTRSLCIYLSSVVAKVPGSDVPDGGQDGGPHVGLFKIFKRQEAESGDKSFHGKTKENEEVKNEEVVEISAN